MDDRIRKLGDKFKERGDGVQPMEVEADKGRNEGGVDNDPLDDSQEERRKAREVVNKIRGTKNGQSPGAGPGKERKSCYDFNQALYGYYQKQKGKGEANKGKGKGKSQPIVASPKSQSPTKGKGRGRSSAWSSPPTPGPSKGKGRGKNKPQEQAAKGGGKASGSGKGREKGKSKKGAGNGHNKGATGQKTLSAWWANTRRE